ncbi:MAG: archease [Deltaproteobacteria bacterium]|nr:archease [Deltaproteobacteria bacterium]
MKSELSFELIDHTADLALRFRGASLEQLFERAARGMFEYAIEDLDRLAAGAERAIELTAGTDAELLVDWLNELLFLLDARRELHAWPRLEHVGHGRLTGRAGFATVDRAGHRLRNPVKAATYHGLRLEQRADGWLAEVLFDL